MKKTVLAVSVTAVLLQALPAAATTLVRMSLSQLAQASTAIVQGHVVAQTTRVNASQTRIMTYTTVQLDKALKGQPNSTVIIEQPGGTIGNVHVRVPGTAFLSPQTEYVLFLERVPGSTGTYHMVGMMQGAFRVYRGRNGADRRVALPLGALSTGACSQTLSQSPTLTEFQMTISGVLAAPIVIPEGTPISVVVTSVQFQGAGQAAVVARTTSDLFPSKALVIPAGSQVVGVAQREGKKWKIYWTSVSVRGRQVHLSGMNETAAGENLKGRALVIQMRRR